MDSLTLSGHSTPQHIVHCPDDVIPGHLITKDKRHEIHGVIAGGAGSRKPEDLQRQQIIQGTGIPCSKTNTRINLRTSSLHNISCPNKEITGFDYTEDFDGVQTIHENHQIYINLKCIVGKGGSQTRSLREVYWFVEGQLNVIKNNNNTNVFFANILDGDESHAVLPKFEYLLSLPEFTNEKNNVYVGDLTGYFSWFKRMFVRE